MAETEKDDLIDKISEIMKEQTGTDTEGDDLSEPDADTELNSPEEQIELLAAQRDEYRERFMRALADAENTRKRGERDRREAEKYGGTKLARDMLPVYDNLIRALDSATEEQRKQNAALIEGVELTLRELENVFSKHGVEILEPVIGDKFDPQLHQAMFEAALPETKQGDIIQVMAKGFMLHERLLRPAQVGVSSNPSK